MTVGSQCYDATKARTCCATCHYLSSYGTPGKQQLIDGSVNE